MTIPKLVHQMCRDKEDMSKRYHRMIENAQVLNPGYTFRLYDEVEANAFVRENYEKKIYDRYTALPFEDKERIWRYLILNKYGGIYLHVNSAIIESLDNYIQENDEGIITRERNEYIFVSWIMIFSPEHYLLRKCIQEWMVPSDAPTQFAIAIGRELTTVLNNEIGPIIENYPVTLYHLDDEKINKLLFTTIPQPCRCYGYDTEIPDGKPFAKFEYFTRTLVIILGQTRAHERTFQNIKKNVLEELDADLCLCVGINKGENTKNNPFHKYAQYEFLHEETNDYGPEYDHARVEILRGKENDKEKLEGIVTFLGSPENIKGAEIIHDFQNAMINPLYDEIVRYSDDFPIENLRGKTFGIPRRPLDDIEYYKEEGVTTYKNRLPFRQFLKIQNFLFGGIKDEKLQQAGSGGILHFYRWFLLHNLRKSGLIHRYDRFVITRSDFLWRVPHPSLKHMEKEFVWIPDGEHYGGYTDRHAILSKDNIESYLNPLECFFLRSNEYFMKMKTFNEWNIENLLRFHLYEERKIIREFPYVMYCIRLPGGSTSWSLGEWCQEEGYYIKYPAEYIKSLKFKKTYEELGNNKDLFYLIDKQRYSIW